MEQKVLDILKALFELETVDTSISQENCEKWDSMGQLNLVAELEMEFDISLEPEEIGVMISYKDIVNLLKSKGVK